MSEREPGWYEVQVSLGDDIEDAYWDGCVWHVPGLDIALSKLEWMGPHIPEPEEV